MPMRGCQLSVQSLMSLWVGETLISAGRFPSGVGMQGATPRLAHESGLA